MKIKVECTLCLHGPEGIIPNVDCPVHGFSRIRELLMESLENNEYEGPCNIDHKGFCQTHFDEPPCRVTRIREALDVA